MRRATAYLAAAAIGTLGLCGCRVEEVLQPLDIGLQRMLKQPRYEVYQRNDFFDDRRAMRPPPEGTVPYLDTYRGPLRMQGQTATGELVKTVPIPVTDELLGLGRARYEITCAACHGFVGTGDTVVAEQMRFVKPVSLLSERIREVPDGYLFQVITEGFGLMPAYVSQLDEEERWAVVAYVRALQLSQHAQVTDLPAPLREQLRKEAR